MPGPLGLLRPRPLRAGEPLVRGLRTQLRGGHCKPDERIFSAAARLAGVAPEEIFYTDDLPGHVAAARRAGFDAVQYTSPAALYDELASRGVRINY